MSSAHRNIISARIVDIALRDNRRELNALAVADLARSIQAIGLQTPITARIDPDEQDYILVAGRHRLEAVKSLGHDRIDCQLVEWSEDQARMWEISENLHRADLTVQQRSDQVAEWVTLCDKPAQLAQVSGGRGRTGGVSAASRELGIERTDIQRAQKIAGIAPDAKAAAADAGLDNNQSALLKIARIPLSQQAAAVRQIADDRKRVLTDEESVEKQFQGIVSAWNRAGPEARDQFKAEYIDTPVMDRRFGS